MSKNQTQSESKAPKMVPVLNNSNRLIDFTVMNRPAGTAGVGPVSRMVRFLPGNNSISEADIKECANNPMWAHHVEKRIHKDLFGKGRKTKLIEVGVYDEELEVEAQELGERMHELKQKQRSA